MAEHRAGVLWRAHTVPSGVLRLKTSKGQRLYVQSWIDFAYSDHPHYAGERKVTTLRYAHRVSDDPAFEAQMFAWEWNSATGHDPHVHVNRGHPEAKGFGKLHIPTGRVFLEQIVAFLVRDLGVVPRRDDWARVLDANLDRVSRFATWGGAAHTISAN